MDINLRKIKKSDLPQAAAIWNEVVVAANSFPGDTILANEQAWEMFCAQTETVVAALDDSVLGVYLLHANNIGHCGHIANASYAVSSDVRGQGIGKAMVTHSIEMCKKNGFRGLQFNAVVCTNTAAIALYLKLGFTILGTVTGGYRNSDGTFVDTLIFLKSW